MDRIYKRIFGDMSNYLVEWITDIIICAGLICFAQFTLAISYNSIDRNIISDKIYSIVGWPQLAFSYGTLIPYAKKMRDDIRNNIPSPVSFLNFLKYNVLCEVDNVTIVEKVVKMYYGAIFLALCKVSPLLRSRIKNPQTENDERMQCYIKTCLQDSSLIEDYVFRKKNYIGSILLSTKTLVDTNISDKETRKEMINQIVATEKDCENFLLNLPRPYSFVVFLATISAYIYTILGTLKQINGEANEEYNQTVMLTCSIASFLWCCLFLFTLRFAECHINPYFNEYDVYGMYEIADDLVKRKQSIIPDEDES